MLRALSCLCYPLTEKKGFPRIIKAVIVARRFDPSISTSLYRVLEVPDTLKGHITTAHMSAGMEDYDPNVVAASDLCK